MLITETETRPTVDEAFGLATEEEVARAWDSAHRDLLTAHVAYLRLGARAYNSVRRGGLDTVGELVACTEADLTDIRSLGLLTVEEIKAALAAVGLALAVSS